MKKMALCLGALVFMAGFKKEGVYSNPPTEPTCASNLRKGLLAYYPFNGNFKDASGNGHHANPKNGAYLTTDHQGKTNRSAGFDGDNDYLIVPGSAGLNADSLSISFYVMVNSADRRNVTVSRINYETGESLIFGIHESMPTDKRWNFGVTSVHDDCSSMYGYSPSLANYTKGSIQAGRWYNIIATFGKGVQQLYVDGVLQSSKKRSFQTAKKCSKADLLIGGWWKADIVSIDGKLDEVRLYNRVLNECEIAKLAGALEQPPAISGRLTHKR
jgi:hypothetical protein